MVRLPQDRCFDMANRCLAAQGVLDYALIKLDERDQIVSDLLYALQWQVPSRPSVNVYH